MPMENINSNNAIVHSMNRNPIISFSLAGLLPSAYKNKYGDKEIYECPICIVESEIHMVQALEDIKNAGCNALVVYLGNFGPEIAETLLPERKKQNR